MPALTCYLGHGFFHLDAYIVHLFLLFSSILLEWPNHDFTISLRILDENDKLMKTIRPVLNQYCMACARDVSKICIVNICLTNCKLYPLRDQVISSDG